MRDVLFLLLCAILLALAAFAALLALMGIFDAA